MKRLVLLIALFSAVLRAAPLSQSREERVGLRLISVRTEAEAATLRAQIQAGAPFEALAREHSLDSSASAGGFIGLLRLTDLKPELQQALNGVAPGQTSKVTPVDGGFILLQRLGLDEANWSSANDAGLQAFRQGRYDEAAKSFQEAVQYAEKLKPTDYRLEDSLHGLAESNRLQKKYAEALPVYRRYLAMHWGGTNAPDVLDQFSALIALSYFPDSQFAETLRKFKEALERAPLSEQLYEAMSTILFKAELMPEAEMLLVRATQLFPASKDAHYRLAELYLVSEKTQKALEVFEKLSRMKTSKGVDPETDRLQQSVVYQKIALIRARQSEFDEAVSAYKRALELTPDSVETRLGLGDIYVRQGRPEEALAEYSRGLAAAPQNVVANFRVADAHLRMGHWAEAGAAAAKVLALDPNHLRAHYVQATALIQTGQKEQGERAFEQYRKLEAEARAQTDKARNIVVLNRGAATKLLEGHPEEAIEMFLKIIESYPDAPANYVNLGTAQSKMGRHQAAIDTFKKMVSLGMDNFLVYRNLAAEYRELGNLEASRPPEVVYLQNLDVALREALEVGLE
jgi:tetratricopeptide (TPR) repeat protein